MRRAAGRRGGRRCSWREPNEPPEQPSSLAAAMLETLRFLALLEVIGLAAVPLAAPALGRLPGAGLGFAKLLGLLLVGWLVWMAASLGDRAATRGADRRPPSRSSRSRRAGRAAPARLARRLAEAGAARAPRALAPGQAGRAGAAAADPSAAACGSARRSCSPSPSRRRRCSAPTRRTSGAPRSRWTWCSSTPRSTRDAFPPHDPWMAGERAQLLLPRPAHAGAADRALSGSSRARATTSRLAALLALAARPSSRSRDAVGRRARGARPAAPVGGGRGRASALLAGAGNLARRRGGGCGADGPLRRLRLVRAPRA